MQICFSFIQKLCSNNYDKARCGFNMWAPFRHNAHKASIILVTACFIYIYIYAINAIFSCFFFTAVLMGWVKFGTLYSFWLLYK